MNLDLLLKLVREPSSIDAAHQADLEALVEEYPFFTAAHLLLLKVYKEQNSIHFNKQLRKVAALAPSREHVYDLVEVLPTLDENNVKEQTEEAALPLEKTHQPSVVAMEPNMVVGTPDQKYEANEKVAEEPGAGPEPDQKPEEDIHAEPSLGVAAPLPEGLDETGIKANEVEVTTELDLEETTATDESIGLTEDAEVFSIVSTVSDANNLEVTPMVAADPFHEAEMPFIDPESASDEYLEHPLIESEQMPAQALEGDTALPVHTFKAEEPIIPESSMQVQATIPLVANIEHADFVSTSHDRISWFRFFAGKPLREQPDDVLEQLYMEHMQQDLLKAPDVAPVANIKAKINLAEEVASSVSMEEEIKRLAYDSISDDELPASETLARIYEQQHEYKRAIKIYQKLILKFPDKMTYFAVLIEELRKKA